MDADQPEDEEPLEEFTVVDRHMHEMRRIIDKVEAKSCLLDNRTSTAQFEIESINIFLCISKNDTRSKSIEAKASGLNFLYEVKQQSKQSRTYVYSATCCEFSILDNHQSSIFKYVLECSHRPINFYLSFNEQRYNNKCQEFSSFKKVSSSSKAQLIELSTVQYQDRSDPQTASRLSPNHRKDQRL